MKYQKTCWNTLKNSLSSYLSCNFTIALTYIKEREIELKIILTNLLNQFSREKYYGKK